MAGNGRELIEPHKGDKGTETTMADKEPTQGVPETGTRRDSPRGDRKAGGLIPKDERGAGGGGPFHPKDADGDFHGGQSGAAYHGHGRLGEKGVGSQESVNAPSEDP